MSYKCSICGSTARRGQARLVHVVRRPNGQTERELAVCAACRDRLDGGTSLAELVRLFNPPRPLPRGLTDPSVAKPLQLGLPAKRL